MTTTTRWNCPDLFRLFNEAVARLKQGEEADPVAEPVIVEFHRVETPPTS
jgi:hypothetical protein